MRFAMAVLSTNVTVVTFVALNGLGDCLETIVHPYGFVTACEKGGQHQL